MIQLFEVLPRQIHTMVQHDLTLYNFAKVGVEGSNPFARSSFSIQFYNAARRRTRLGCATARLADRAYC